MPDCLEPSHTLHRRAWALAWAALIAASTAWAPPCYAQLQVQDLCWLGCSTQAAPDMQPSQASQPATVTEAAKALPKQQFDKNKVWLILLGGAAGLFGLTVLLESQSGLFPAITRSNQLLRLSASERVRAHAALKCRRACSAQIAKHSNIAGGEQGAGAAAGQR